MSRLMPAVLLALALLCPASAGAAGAPRLLIIAHRGASGERPEHTRAAYDLAIDEGADFIEPDLVISRDGVLIVRHENEISGTTDVSAHPEFAARRTTKTIDGAPVTGWFTEDFTLAELKTLRARERLPELRPANAAWDGKEPILTFDEVMVVAERGSRRTGRRIGVYPETKHAAYFRKLGLPLEEQLVRALKRRGLDRRDAPVFIQSFEPESLQRLRRLTRVRLVQLIAAQDPETDRRALSPEGLRRIAGWADVLGVEKSLILPRDADSRSAGSSDLVVRAHAAGVQVHAWTFRAENYFLPLDLRRGDAARPDYLRLHGDLAAEIARAESAGVDGLFSDFPGLAAKAR